ncbi:rubrerythrin family protein [Thiohalobacter sp. IOR34]|uniref:rubrerythrin family protein n=1 Tax=Thiohalobacter sp. IOR34 TaxID=3057176 RepID=UPI0025B1D3C6|nr:rubrerythrin family protein [Thiohalobacter sp. IOR34]WJW75614.1 rubrerythrin family protein [Thiohalobacter sp. IOR34]
MNDSNPESITVKNLEAALAGESMAHIKYLYFARICRAQGDEETAAIFEATAAQEVQHAFGHMDLLYPPSELDPARCLELAIAGETHEYTEMYPSFRHLAEQEQREDAVREFDAQIEESREHAERFQTMLAKAAKRFAALTKVEQRHARHYREALDQVRR